MEAIDNLIKSVLVDLNLKVNLKVISSDHITNIWL